MATPSFKLFISKDLLDSLQLNPWFERWRRYGLAVCVVASLFCFYVTTDFAVYCEPVTWNASTIVTFTKPVAERVNTCCKNGNQLKIFRWSGLAMLLFSIEALMFSSYWLHRHQTVDVFRTFAKARDLIESCDVKPLSIKSLMTSPLTAKEAIASKNEKHYNIREACRLLTLMKPKTNVRTQYLTRNLLLFMTLTSAIFVTPWTIWNVIFTGDEFDCFVRSNEKYVHYTCAHSIGDDIVFCWIAFGLGSLLQVGMIVCSIWKLSMSWFIVCIIWIVLTLSVCLGSFAFPQWFHWIYLDVVVVIWICVTTSGILPIIFGIWKLILKSTRYLLTRYCRFYKYQSEDDKIEEISASFMSSIWELSQPSNSGVVREFTDFLFSEKYRISLENMVEKILRNGDVELLQIRKQISKKSCSIAINTFSRIGDVSIEYFNAVVCNVDYEVEECKEFISWALENEMWALFIIFLNNAKGTLPVTDEDRRAICEHQNLNFHSYRIPVFMSDIPIFQKTTEYKDESSSRAVGNLLFYAFNCEFGENKQGPYKVMKFILKNFQLQHFFVHFSQRDSQEDFSIDASEYLENEKEEFLQRGMNIKEHTNLKESFVAAEMRASPTSGLECQQEIQTFLEKYQDTTESNTNNDKLRQLANDLVTKKFCAWDENAIKFLIYANEKAIKEEESENHWRILIALLNAYIVTETEELNCPVTLMLPDKDDTVYDDKISALVKAMLWKSPLGYLPRACQYLIRILFTKTSTKDIANAFKKYKDNTFAKSLVDFAETLERGVNDSNSLSLEENVETISQNEGVPDGINNVNGQNIVPKHMRNQTGGHETHDVLEQSSTVLVSENSRSQNDTKKEKSTSEDNCGQSTSQSRSVTILSEAKEWISFAEESSTATPIDISPTSRENTVREMQQSDRYQSSSGHDAITISMSSVEENPTDDDEEPSSTTSNDVVSPIPGYKETQVSIPPSNQDENSSEGCVIAISPFEGATSDSTPLI